MCGCVMADDNIRLYLLQAVLHHRRHQRWVDPTNIHLTSCLLPRQSANHTVVKVTHFLPMHWDITQVSNHNSSPA